MDPPLFIDMRATEKAVVVGMRVGSSDDVGSANRVETAVGSRYLVEGERKGRQKRGATRQRQRGAFRAQERVHVSSLSLTIFRKRRRVAVDDNYA